MNHIERFYATIDRKPVDYPASWLGLPVPEAGQGLIAYFKIAEIEEMTGAIGDDIVAIEMPYHSPDANAIYTALNFAKDFEGTEEERTLTAKGFFEGYTDPTRVDDFPWPDPKLYIDPDECRRLVDQAPEGKVLMGIAWSSHFQDACAAFGMEEALMKMLLEPDMFRVVIDRILDFYLESNEIFYKATEGKLHAILIGNDLGSQCNLLVSPQYINEFVLGGTKKLVEQAHRYGLKVVHHSCGAIRPIISDLIETGVDVIHPIQALATGMEPEGLKNDFGDRVAFCGGVDAQHLLVNGRPEEIKDKVSELKRIFPTGLILSPSHEAILPDVPPENVEALFEAVKA